jgi:hypothetical protein
MNDQSLHFVIGAAVGLVIFTLAYIGYYCWRIASYKHWEPSKEDIDREIRLIQLEREHFGHPIMFHAQQTKEYKKWLESLK